MSELSTSAKLQTFLLLSKSAKGAANAKLISDALSAPGVYVFSELAEAPNVVEASTIPEVAPYYALLRIFLYGTYKDYLAQQQQQQLPELNGAQRTKLRHLSIVTLSETSRTLPYNVLQDQLDIPNVRMLEDLIIDAIYQGIVDGKLDQRKQHLQVETTMGRDLLPEQVDQTIETLQAWSNNTKTVLEAIDNLIRLSNEVMKNNQIENEEYERHVERVRRAIRARKENANNGGSEEGASSPSPAAAAGGSGESAGLLRGRQPMLIYGDDDASGRAKKRGAKRFMVGRP